MTPGATDVDFLRRALALAIHAQIVITLRERDDAIKMITLDPVLKFARLVARIGAAFEHCDDDDFDGNRPVFGESGNSDQQPQESGEESSKHSIS